jgi:GT2 family glycosyltransferase
VNRQDGRETLPPVTWLLAVRNGMPYLPETLASIAAQTYRNFELIAWDNGSEDGTIEEIRRWIPSRIPGRLIADRPLPLGEARARLVEEASTELCAWTDADDISAPERLERQVEFLLAHPEVAVVGSHIAVIDEQGNRQGDDVRFPLRDEQIVLQMLRGPAVAQPATLFRRSAVLKAGNYRDVGEVHVEDYDLWLRLAVHDRFANVDAALLQYRVHGGSTTVAASRAGRLSDATRARFVENAEGLFGCSPRVATLLVTRSHPCAIVALLQIAGHLKRRSGVGRLRTLRSRDLLNAATDFVAPRDVVSRIALSLLVPGSWTGQTARTLRRGLNRLARRAVTVT